MEVETSTFDKRKGESFVLWLTESVKKNPNRIPDTTVTLDQNSLLVKKDGAMNLKKGTYIAPRAKMATNITFCDLRILRFQTNGIGNIKSTASVMICGIVPPRYTDMESCAFDPLHCVEMDS